MRRHDVVLTVIVAILAPSGTLWALPTTAYEAEMVVTGWLRTDSAPLGTSLGREVAAVETFADDTGTPAYHIVYLSPNGFVIVSADDMIEPIIGFAQDGVYDPSPGRPLGALVTNDLNGRIAAVRRTFNLLAIPPQVTVSRTQAKWTRLFGLALSARDGISLMGEAPIEDNNLSDMRVAPLVQSTWGQTSCPGSDGDVACYNYYTPQFKDGKVDVVEDDPNNYPSGCVATAMAQLMRYYEYPREPIEPETFSLSIEGWTLTRDLLRGSGPDGAYVWSDMPLSPGTNITDQQRRAIGALCHDAGISVSMEYTPDGSGAYLYEAAAAMVKTFRYSNAILGENGESVRSRRELREMINPNLDAGLPVIIGIRNSRYSGGGHALVCDGYGYDNSTPYHHLNMGWSGHNDCWYHMPDINCPSGYPFDLITRCVYNVFTEGAGEIISGRVIDGEGNPIQDAIVTAVQDDDGGVYTAQTDIKGIYALVHVPSDSTYTVSVEKPGYTFGPNEGRYQVATEESEEGSTYSGNVWGVDFRGIGDDNGEVVVSSAKLTASDGRSGDHFGCSVAVSGDYAIVGAYGDDNERGSAYVFRCEGAGWTEQAKLKVSGENKFGFSVAISGDYAIVGAGTTKGSYNPYYSFSAHMFKRDGDTWTLLTKLKAQDYTSTDAFGCSVSICGGYAVVGAPYDAEDIDNHAGLHVGSACIFTRNDADWIFSAKARASDGMKYAYLGYLVSISGEYLISAQDLSGDKYEENYGPVYIFKRNDVTWTEQAKLTTPVGVDPDLFGNSIAISEDWAVVGAPAGDGNRERSGIVYLYKREGTSWTPHAELTAPDGNTGDSFGDSIAISGYYMIIGASDDENDYMGKEAGSAYIFTLDGEGWTQQAKLTAPDGAINDHFGRTVAIDGDFAIVGAEDDDDNGSGSGSAYIFHRIGSTWMP
ncbi:MAG: C10 family peptidase [Planctomycetota bacterium]|jgi:hypothetical protein